MRNFALLALGLTSISPALGSIALFFAFTTALWLHTHIGNSGGHIHAVLNSLKVCFVIRSSKEWNVITPIFPFGFNMDTASTKLSCKIANSLFTSMRMAWNVRFAGCGPS